MAKKRPPKARRRQNTPLLFLLLLLLPLYGGYYNCLTLLAGAVLVPALAYTVCRMGVFVLPAGPEAWCLYGLCACTLVTAPAAVSAGMAFTGFLRLAVWALFFLYAATYTPEERADILDAIAYEGAVLAGASIVAFLYSAVNGLEDANGRIDGFFQYANAWALYLLVCLLLLALRGERRRWDLPAMGVLLCGIYLSGSRGIFLLTLLLAAGYGIRNLRKNPRGLLLGAAGAAGIGALAAVLSGGMVLERLRAITLTSSSLNGRLLYDLDGLRMLAAHPFGLGRGGYLYIQPLEQTGIYTLRYIHNEYLQAALDGGILAGVCLAGMLAAMLLRKETPVRERAVMAAIAVHACIDFDLQFTALAFLLLLCGSGGKSREIAVSRRAPVAAGLALTALFGYFTLTYTLDFLGKPAAAYAMYPLDLSLAENRLQNYATVEAAEETADRILASTDLSILAWDCKYAAATLEGDFPAMAEAKYQYLRLTPYWGEVYEEFAALLENAEGGPAERTRYGQLALAAMEQLEATRDKTSPLAYRIVDKPNWEFAGEVLERLKAIAEEG